MMIKPAIFFLILTPFFLQGQSSITDTRDGLTYEIVKLDELYWMKDNLLFNAKGSIMLEGNDKYRFYSFENLDSVCPDGWRLPTIEDWDTFTESFEDVEKARMMEENRKLYRVDFLEKHNIFKANVLNIQGFGRIEGGNLRDGDFIDFWTVNPETNDVRFHMHLTPYSIMAHAHKHHLKPSKPEEFRLFPVRCVCEANKLLD